MKRHRWVVALRMTAGGTAATVLGALSCSTPGGGSGASAAQSIVGTWSESVGSSFCCNTSYCASDSPATGGPATSTATAHNQGTWASNGNQVTVTWPYASAPGGAYIDSLTVSADGNSFSGTNNAGSTIAGVRTSATCSGAGSSSGSSSGGSSGSSSGGSVCMIGDPTCPGCTEGVWCPTYGVCVPTGCNGAWCLVPHGASNGEAFGTACQVNGECANPGAQAMQGYSCE